jgi:hypothetical protein
VSIQGKPPALAIGCVAYFSADVPWLRLEVFDPEPNEIEPIAIEFDGFVREFWDLAPIS